MKRIIIDNNNLDEAIKKATKVLAKGGLVIYPTETVYGVGVDASNKDAVTKLLAYKNRPAGRAISVLVDDRDDAAKYVNINSVADNIYKNFLPGPITVISDYAPKENNRVDERLLSELNTLGIRISSHPVAQKLALAFDKPITATSANASGKARPYNIEQIFAGLSEKQISLIDLILDFGELPPNDPSTVVDTTQNAQDVVRSGNYFEKMVPVCYSRSEEETIVFANKFTHSIFHYLPDRPVLITLEGEMGSGKTYFAKGVAAALGVNKVITSPTFNLIKQYEGATIGEITGSTEENVANCHIKLAHIDLWRLQTITQDELEMSNYWQPGNVILIEWPSPILPDLEMNKDRYIWFKVEFAPGKIIETDRNIYIHNNKEIEVA